MEPKVVMALNAACASLSGQSGSPLLESCVRVSSRPGEEKWVLAKRVHGRYLYFVFDSCPTLVDMLEFVRGTVDGPLSNIYFY